MKKPHNLFSRYKMLTPLRFVLGAFFILLFSWPAGAVQLTEPAPAPDTVSILLIGQDRREGEPRARSDCMLLCTLQPDTGTLTMTSFLRDLYVEIPGWGKNRINAAYAFGGSPLLRQTLQRNFGIDPDGCVEVDFGQFPTLIDLMGGVPVELRQDEADCINAEVPGAALQSGSQVLSGQQALAYARIRDLDADGDFSRTDRQRKIITALFRGCSGRSLTELLRLYKKAAPMFSTDFHSGQLLKLMADYFPVISKMNVRSQSIPIAGSYSHQMVDGMAVLVADLERNRAFLKDTLG